MTLNARKTSKFDNVKTTKHEFDDNELLRASSTVEKKIIISSDDELKKVPSVIPITDSGHGLQPPFNIRIQYNDKSDLIKETVSLNMIKGTVTDQHLIDSEFHPKRSFVNKRFRKVWTWIQSNPNNNENVILPSTIVLAKITDKDYYVVEGLRRVVALKFSNIKAISVFVIDYRDVYNKILQRRKNIEQQKKRSKNDIIHANSNFKPVKPRIRPTPVLKGQPRK